MHSETKRELAATCRTLCRLRRKASTMRRMSRIYTESGADFLATDAMHRARHFQRRARQTVKSMRVLRAIAMLEA